MLLKTSVFELVGVPESLGVLRPSTPPPRGRVFIRPECYNVVLDLKDHTSAASVEFWGAS